MQRPSSSLSNYSTGATSSTGVSSLAGTMRRPGLPQRQQRPGGPRKPSAKALPSIPQHQQQRQQQPQQQQQQQQQQERHDQHRQSQTEQPPSYVQSQHDAQTQGPLQSYTPPPTSAVTSDSSCSHPPMSVFTRADTPSSMSALSPVRTVSPALALEPLHENSPAHQSPRQQQASVLPLVSSSVSNIQAQAQTGPSRTSSPSIPSISKPSTPAPPDSPTCSSTAYNSKPRLLTTQQAMPPPLQPPPAIDFAPAPLPFKALTLDAAQWTFSSAELQAIVSRAIRASAEPSSIRLLPLQTIDEDLVREVERLESERASATAQYRFTMHRRTMLLQSLNASSGSSVSPSPSTSAYSGNTSTINLSQNPPLSAAADLAQRLAEVSVTLDRLAAGLVRISDQLAQIRSLQDVHAASALAVALRKLNASYARRTREIETLKEKLATTEEERDEAWRVAEELAMEFDEDEVYNDDVVVNGERAVAVPATLTRASRVGMKIKVPGVGPRIRQQQPDAENSGAPPENEAGADASASNNAAESANAGEDRADGAASGDSAADASATPIARRRRANSATSRVTAARTRSIRASKASLRFPRKAASSSRPPSTYSQHSTHSQSGGGGPSRARSRSRANSISSLRDGSPTSANAHGAYSSGVGTGGSSSIPDVPKIPNATELARLASVKSNASSTTGATSATTTAPPLPPIPPPIETSPTKICSFLDMTTHPNSTASSPEKSTPSTSASTTAEKEEDGNAGLGAGSEDNDRQRPQGESLKDGGNTTKDAQDNGSMQRTDAKENVVVHVDDDAGREEAETGNADDEEAQIITVPSHPNHKAVMPPFSASLAESSNTSGLHPEIGTAKKQIATRPSLQVYPPAWARRLPPDSPVDVTRTSGPHRADNGDDDVLLDDEEAEEVELEHAFETAYARTEMNGMSRAKAYIGRSPLRTQHTQSLLPFPGSSSSGAGTGRGRSSAFIVTNNPNDSGPSHARAYGGMKRSPASDNQVPRSGSGTGAEDAGPFRGAALSLNSSSRRPASLPSAQGEKPWDYF